MFEFLRQLATGVAEAWRRLSVSARIQIGLAALLTALILGGVMLFGSQPQYITLYTRLDPAESDSVVEYLAENGIPYQLRDGGRQINVPAQQAGSTRVDLAGQGIPRGQGTIPGFEIFDTQSLMTNKWLQDTNYMRALNGELTRALNQFDFVVGSTVHISEARDQLFRSEQKPSKASVILALRRSISDEEIAAVLHTVAAYGGHNLNEKNISVADTQGNWLKRPQSDAAVSLASDRRDTQAAWEAHFQNKVLQALDTMGYNAIVTASVQVDWDTVERQQRELAEGEVISSLETTTDMTTQEAPPEGAPGAIANIPEGTVLPGGLRTTSKVEELTENREPGWTDTRTMTPPGALERISLAVVVGEVDVQQTDANGEVTVVRQAPTPQILSTIESLATSAVSGAATDTVVTVEHVPFPGERLALAGVTPLTAGAPWYQNRTLLFVMQGFLILAAFLVIRFFMRRALVVPAAQEEEAVEIPEATKEDMRRMEIASEVERLSREDPAAVAALLRSWMAQEE